MFVQGDVASVERVSLKLVISDSKFLSKFISVKKYGCYKAYSAEILLLGDNSKILWRRSMQSYGIWFFIWESSFLNLFFKISYDDAPVFIDFFIKSLVASISKSSSYVGSPIYSVITFANAFEVVTVNKLDFLPKNPKSNLRKTIPADQMSILVS